MAQPNIGADNNTKGILTPARILSVLLITLLLIGRVDAEPTGKIAGTVYDATTRSPLFGASVVVKATTLGASADPDGRFLIAYIPAGIYTVTATMLGYRSLAKTSVVVAPGRTTELVFSMDPEAILMPETSVRPQHFSKVKDATVSERNFTAEEIKVQPGGLGDIQRVVQAMPAVTTSGDQVNEMIVRGGNQAENLFLVDGVEIASPNHFATQIGQAGAITLFNSLLVREVDFIAGAFPARFGERASSVMDIALRRGSMTELEGSVDLGMAGLGAIVEFPLPVKDGSFIGSYHKSFLEILSRMKVFGEGGVPHYDNALGKLTFKPSPGHQVSILGIWGADYVDEDGTVQEDLGSKHQYFRTERRAVGAGWQTLFGTRGYGKLLLSTSSSSWHLLTNDTALAPPLDTIYRTKSSERLYAGQYDLALRLSASHETEAGVKFALTPFTYYFYQRPETVFVFRYNPDGTILDSVPLLDSLTHQPVVAGINQADDFKAWRSSAYLQHRYRFLKNYRLTLGLRADWFDYTGQLDISPRLGFSTEPIAAGFSFHAGYGWHFQPPQYFVLAYDPDGNHQLKSQRSEHYVVGTERLLADDIKLSAEAYYKRMKHLAIPRHWTTPDPYDYSGRYLDIGHGRAQGIELFLQKKYAQNWHGTVAYSLSSSRIANPQDTSKTVPGDHDNRHVVTLAAARKFEFVRHDWYQHLPGWFKYSLGVLLLSDEADFGARFRYMGGRPYTPQRWVNETRAWATDGNAVNSLRYPYYLRLDLRWDHKFIFDGWNLAWYVELQNLTDRKNIWWYTYKDDGSIEPYYQFRFTPLGGLVVEF